MCDTPSPESITVSVVRPGANKNSTVSRGMRQSNVAIRVGACDPGGRPLGLAPRSPPHEGGNTHLSKNT